MIVILNNGCRVKINKAIALVLARKGIITQWQAFIEDSTDEVNYLFNMNEVSLICNEDDILPEPSDTLEQIGLFRDSLSENDEHGRFWAEKFRRFVLDKKTSV